MNERFRKLAEHCGAEFYEGFAGSPNSVKFMEEDFERFAEMLVRECAQQLVQSNMSNPEYARAMDEHYEQKWAHRFD